MTRRFFSPVQFYAWFVVVLISSVLPINEVTLLMQYTQNIDTCDEVHHEIRSIDLFSELEI